jgi:hypothetical protein
MANPIVANLMQKEMSRKEFLGILVLAVGSIFGMEHIIKLFTGKSLSTHKSLNSFGKSGYGK